MLVVKQLNGIWACRATHLVPMYEYGLRLVRELQERDTVIHVVIEHVYREYNGEADSLANQALDDYISRTHTNGVVVDTEWTIFNIASARWQDEDGDIIMA